MKKYFILTLLIFAFVLAGILLFNKNEDSTLKKVKVAEVAHSIFYAPQYVAHKLGYFKEEGLDVEIILTSGADKVTAAVLSGDVNIGFCGSEATIYVYEQGEKDYLVNFAGLTKRDGSFLVAREKYDNFTLEDLKNKTIIAGRKGGMPAMTLEWALKQNGINKTDTEIDTSIAFAAMSGAFISGIGDYVALFEPNALEIEKNGYGYIVASVGELGGVVPYTSYNARKSYIEENPDVIEGFTNAIQKGIDFVHNNESKEVAKLLIDYFPDTSLDDLTTLVERHKKIDSWFTTTKIKEDDFNHIQDIMINAGELKNKVPYNKLVK